MVEIKKEKLKIQIFDTRKAMGEASAKLAAKKIKELISSKGGANVIFAAAPSQDDMLKALIAIDEIDWSKVIGLHMDEYIGLPKGASQTFRSYLDENIFSKVPFKKVFYLEDCMEEGVDAAEKYTSILKEFPVDMVCMGVGENGHIAFNDPGFADFNDSSLVKYVDLDDKCRQQQVNDGCFPDFSSVPSQALTLTIPALTSASMLVCVVPGERKADAIGQMINEEISESCPASIIRRHSNAVLFLDNASAVQL